MSDAVWGPKVQSLLDRAVRSGKGGDDDCAPCAYMSDRLRGLMEGKPRMEAYRMALPETRLPALRVGTSFSGADSIVEMSGACLARLGLMRGFTVALRGQRPSSIRRLRGGRYAEATPLHPSRAGAPKETIVRVGVGPFGSSAEEAAALAAGGAVLDGSDADLFTPEDHVVGLNAAQRKNLGVAVGDVVAVIRCPNIEYGRRITVARVAGPAAPNVDNDAGNNNGDGHADEAAQQPQPQTLTAGGQDAGNINGDGGGGGAHDPPQAPPAPLTRAELMSRVLEPYFLTFHRPVKVGDVFAARDVGAGGGGDRRYEFVVLDLGQQQGDYECDYCVVADWTRINLTSQVVTLGPDGSGGADTSAALSKQLMSEDDQSFWAFVGIAAALATLHIIFTYIIPALLPAGSATA
eukprot:g2772.t1